jgi:Protein of unknown function (DUF3311)
VRTRHNWILLLLLIPYIALLWPPFYASLQPLWLGIPYFIWYQFLWTVLAAGITALVYVVQHAGAPE